MRNLIIISLISLLCLSAKLKSEWPDLANKEDLKALGIGRIFEKDKSVITKIILEEVNEYAIIFIKDESLHDIAIDQVARIEFRETKWGPVVITFPENKPRITTLEE